MAESDVVLYDIDPEKAERMANLGRRLQEAAGARLNIRATADPDEAVDGADYALSSIGGSGAEMVRGVHGSYYHSADMHICARFGIQLAVGDTGGPPGMMMALRSIPAHIDICRRMERRCPAVVFLNHSNPMATIMRALHKYTDIKSYGLCHGVQGGIGAAADLLELPAEELECTWIGTNHYHWFTRVRHRGADVLPELMKRTRERSRPSIMRCRRPFPERTGIASSTLTTAIRWSSIRSPPTPQPGRTAIQHADSARRHGFDTSHPMPVKAPPTRELRQSFLADYQGILDQTELPERKEDSRSGEGPVQIIAAMATGKRLICIVNMANGGAIANLPATAEVEVEAVTETGGARALTMGEAPLVLKGILEKRFVWHELVADAAVTGDRGKALQALLVDEMAIEPGKAEAMLDELLAASRDLLPRFFP